MKRDRAKKLTLVRTTLRTLGVDELSGAAGAVTLATCSVQCSDLICPDTRHGCNTYSNLCVTHNC